MLICDFSSEKIFVWEKTIENRDLEKILPKIILETTKDQQNIFVINGPWSFNGLRIWILCLNLLNKLENNFHTFFEISKPNLAYQLFEMWKIWKKGLIYIGQRKNFWLIDCEKKILEKVSKSEINFSKLDWIEDMTLLENEILEYEKNWNKLEKIVFVDFLKTLDEKYFSNFEAKKILETNYMIEPNIG